MKDTLLINLFGAPGCGKSTGATYLFSMMKMSGIDSEYVPEFAKDMVWQERRQVFDDPENQLYIFGEQFYRINSLWGKVDVIVTDSPLLLSVIYSKKSLMLGDEYATVVRRISRKFKKHVNFFVRRVKKFNPNGRNESEEKSDEISVTIRSMLDELGEDYVEFDGDHEGYDSMLRWLFTNVEIPVNE